MIALPQMRALPSAALGIASDPYWSSVVFLCHFDSSSGSPRAFVQLSPLGSAIANASGTVPDVSATQSKFGGFSLAYAASGNNRCASNDNDYQMGTGDFTLEWFQRLGSVAASYNLLDLRSISNQVAPTVYSTASGGINYFVSNADRITSANSVLVANTWQHIAMTRSGTSSKLWVGGTQVGSTYTDSNNYSGSSLLTVGAGFNGGAPALSSFFDEVRITKGVARYTATFTPPSVVFPAG